MFDCLHYFLQTCFRKLKTECLGHPPSISRLALSFYVFKVLTDNYLTLPNSEQRAVALKVLGEYLKRFDSPQTAATALKPYAAEADARGIRQTNLCWLSEWAAVGQIPKLRKKWLKHTKPEVMQEDQADYASLRKHMETELAPHMNGDKRNSL